MQHVGGNAFCSDRCYTPTQLSSYKHQSVSQKNLTHNAINLYKDKHTQLHLGEWQSGSDIPLAYIGNKTWKYSFCLQFTS